MPLPDPSLPLPDFAYVGAARVRFDRSLHQRPRRVEHHRFLHVESGHGEFVSPLGRLTLENRLLLLLSPGEREIRYDETRPVSYLYVEFRSAHPLISTPWLRCPESSPHHQALVHLLRSIRLEEGANATPLLAAAVSLVLRDPVPRAVAGPADDRIRRALDLVERHLDRPLRVGDLARAAGCSEPHFRRLFRTAMSCGPKEYLLRERMHYARRILQDEGLRVGEVADLLQFDSVYQFSKQFRKVLGRSPSEVAEGRAR